MAFDDFVLDHWRNDIALVKMRDTVPLGSDIFPQIQSVTLPERGDTAFPADAARCTMVGWGCTSQGKNDLQEVLRIIASFFLTEETLKLSCLSEDTLKTISPFYILSMPFEVKYPTRGNEKKTIVDSITLQTDRLQ